MAIPLIYPMWVSMASVAAWWLRGSYIRRILAERASQDASRAVPATVDVECGLNSVMRHCSGRRGPVKRAQCAEQMVLPWATSGD